MLYNEEAQPLCEVSVMALLYQYISIHPSETLWPALRQQQISSECPGICWLSNFIQDSVLHIHFCLPFQGMYIVFIYCS